MKKVLLVLITVAIILSSIYCIWQDQGYNFGHNDARYESWQKGNQAGYLAVYDIGHQKSSIKGNIFNYVTEFKKGLFDGQYLGKEIGKAEGYDAVYGGAIEKDGFLHNPTMEELSSFLLNDHTNQQKYIEESYNCVNFSASLRRNAKAKGLKAGTICLTYKDPKDGKVTNHQMNFFQTQDEGTVLVEPQTDSIIPEKSKEDYFFPRLIKAFAYCQ